MRTQLFVTAVLLCLGLCAGCGEPPPLDTGLLTGEPCEPPCWQGLTPGESTLQEVNEFIRTTRWVNPQTLYRSGLYRAGGERVGLSIRWHSTAGGYGIRNRFTIHGGVLDSITINPDYPLTLERLFERYGPPDKYVARLSGPEILYVDVTLFYPTHGFTVDLVLGYHDATLQRETRVASVWYFRAAPLERFLELRWEEGYVSSTPDESLQYLHDWQGYGAIELD